MVELLVANEKVAGSNLVSRSKIYIILFMPESHRSESGFFVAHIINPDVLCKSA